ncbi:MAG: glycosyltransferase [Bacteroidota bacterium]
MNPSTDKLRFLVNLIPIKKGGGQQVALNFVENLEILRSDHPQIEWYATVTEGTYIHRHLEKQSTFVKFFQFPSNPVRRLLQENRRLSQIVDEHGIDLVYTMFGPSVPPLGIPTITGCAYSNLFFPEIDFWGKHSWKNRTKAKLIDKFRLSRTLAADAIVFENESMLERAVSLFNYPREKTIYIPPSISLDKGKDDDSFDYGPIRQRCQAIQGSDNLLMLTGWHKNKNIELSPAILQALVAEDSDANIVITIPPDHPGAIRLMQEAAQLGVEKRLIFFGSVAPQEVKILFQSIRAVLLLSLLESFSNNIIESWVYERPLIISDEAWSRALCGDSVVYVERNNPVDIARKAVALLRDEKLYGEIVKKGNEKRQEYPSPSEKVRRQILFLLDIVHAEKMVLSSEKL